MLLCRTLPHPSIINREENSVRPNARSTVSTLFLARGHFRFSDITCVLGATFFRLLRRRRKNSAVLCTLGLGCHSASTAGRIPAADKTLALWERDKETRTGDGVRTGREDEREHTRTRGNSIARLQMLAIARIKDVSTSTLDRHHFIRSPSANKCFPSVARARVRASGCPFDLSHSASASYLTTDDPFPRRDARREMPFAFDYR